MTFDEHDEKQRAAETQRLEILYGGRDIEVWRIEVVDDKPNRVSEQVKVLKIPLRQMGTLCAGFGNEYSEAAVYTGKPSTWVDSLDDESVLLIVLEGRRLNIKNLKAWVEIQKETARLMGVDIDAQLIQAAKQDAESSSQNSSSS